MADLVLLMARDGEELRERVRSVSGYIEMVSREQLEKDDSLWERIGATYGWMKAEEVAKAPNLKWIQITSAGVGALLTPEIKASDLVITNVSGIHAAPIAEQMFGMVLVVTRCLHQAWQAQQKHQWGRDDFGSRVTLLAGKTLGILGVGAIGGYAAGLGKAFGMTVVGLRHSKKPHPDVETMYGDDERAEFLGRCDVVMSVLPSTDATRGWMGEAEFAAIKQGAIFVNTGRGTTVKTDALIASLQSGHLGAACLDVTDPEPLPADHPLWTTPNVYITPHTSGGRPDYGERADDIFLNNLRLFLDGKELDNVVNKEAGY